MHIWKGTIKAEGYIQTDFSREALEHFSKTMLSCILHLFQQHGFKVRVLDWPAFSPENFLCFMKCKI